MAIRDNTIHAPIAMRMLSNMTLASFTVALAFIFAGAAETLSVGCEELRNAQADGKAPVILDVRSAGSYHRAHIEGAISAPYEKLEKQKLAKDKPIVAYCTGIGCSLSNDAAIVLKRRGAYRRRVRPRLCFTL